MDEFKDLTGDPLYDHFKKHVKEGYTLDGARILENKTHTVYSPRKEIEVKISKDNQSETFKYNYNKLLKKLP